MKIIQYGLDITEEVILPEQEEQKKIDMVLIPIKERIDIQKRRYKNKLRINQVIDRIRKVSPAEGKEAITILKRLFVKAGNTDILNIDEAIKFVLPQRVLTQITQNISNGNQQPNNTPRRSRGEGLTRQIF